MRYLKALVILPFTALFAFSPAPTPSQAAPSGLKPGSTFVYALGGKPASYPVQVYFVDLFDTSQGDIAKLKSQGKTVICYYSAGTGEDWRPDYKSIPSSALGKSMPDWKGEKWLDYRNPQVVTLMLKRQQLAKSKGCSGVDPDNVDGHLNKTGFPLSAKDQLQFYTALSKNAATSGLVIGLKNSAETANALASYASFSVVEECFKYKECGKYSAFTQAKKPIFFIEYTPKNASQCKQAKDVGGSLIFANMDLTRFQFCE